MLLASASPFNGTNSVIGLITCLCKQIVYMKLALIVNKWCQEYTNNHALIVIKMVLRVYEQPFQYSFQYTKFCSYIYNKHNILLFENSSLIWEQLYNYVYFC